MVSPGGNAAPPKGGEHHAAKQLRDYHGRFAAIGSRVRGKGGGLGWVKGMTDDGQAVIDTDDGREVTIDPKTMKVATVPGRARLQGRPEVIDDPAARIEAYEAWAVEQLQQASPPPEQPEEGAA